MANFRCSVLLLCSLASLCILALTNVEADSEHLQINRAGSCGTGGDCNPHESVSVSKCSHAEQCVNEGNSGRRLEEEEDVTVIAANDADDDDDDDDTYKSPPASASVSGEASFQADFVVLGH